VGSYVDVSPDAPVETRGHWWVLEGPPSSLAVQLSPSDRWVCACVYPGMIGTWRVDKRGAASLVFRPGDGGSDSDTVAQAAEEAISALHAGTIAGEAASDLATRIRLWKHNDPILGVIASYLYAQVGDFESVRRIAWFYCYYNQPIPFDVALLGGLRLSRRGPLLCADVPATSKRQLREAAEANQEFATVATPAVAGLVAGGIPWLRQGWSLLEDSGQTVLDALLEFTPGLTAALFTTLEPAAGAALAGLIHKGGA